MKRGRIGCLLETERLAQELEEDVLMEGIGTRRVLQKIEDNSQMCRKQTADVLLGRLDRSPDKLEYIMGWQEYRVGCIWEWFMECVFRKNRKWAQRALSLYEAKAGEGAVQRMYLYRGQAMLAYWVEQDTACAGQQLEKALDATLPGWQRKEWDGIRISTVELENALALVRVRQERGEPEDALLERCGAYIRTHVTDGEENAKIYSKYAWLAARQRWGAADPGGALLLCEEAINRLNRYSIEYFMRPLLEMALQCTSLLEGVSENGWRPAAEMTFGARLFGEKREGARRYAEYLGVLTHLHERFGEKWYPTDSVLYGCCQKAYHLDFEMIRAERYAHGMTQEMAAEGVYENAKEIAKIENRKSVPHEKRLRKLMQRFGLEKGRVNGFVMADSFRALKLQKELQMAASRLQYDEMKRLLPKLEQQLDMTIGENRRVIKYWRNAVDIKERNRPYEEILAQDWELLSETYRLSPEMLSSPPFFKGRRGKSVCYRAPMRNEAELINQIALLLEALGRKDEAIRLYGWVLETCERSRVKTKYRYHSYGLLKENLAADLCSIEKSREMLQYELSCGKLGGLAYNYLTLACAMIDDSSNREVCRGMLREVYYLYELSGNETNQNVVKEYYLKKYGEELEKV